MVALRAWLTRQGSEAIDTVFRALGRCQMLGALAQSWSRPFALRGSLQMAMLEKGYPGGIAAYVAKAIELLEASSKGVNPFDGFKPEVSQGAPPQ